MDSQSFQGRQDNLKDVDGDSLRANLEIGIIGFGAFDGGVRGAGS